MPKHTDSGGVVEAINAHSGSHEETKRILSQIRDRENTLRLALDAGHMGIWDWDIPTNVFTWSDGMRAPEGFEHGNRKGTFKAFLRHIYAPDRKKVESTIRAALRHRSTFEAEFRIPSGGGFVRWMYKRGEILLDGKGRPARMIGVGVDITDRKESEADTQKTRKKFQTIFDSSAAAMIITDNTLTIEEANTAAFDIFPVSKRDYHKRLYTLIGKISQYEFWKCWQTALRTGTSKGEMVVDSKKGTDMILEYTIRPNMLPGKHLFVFYDVTTRVAEGKRREEFLGLASHELRTPLASIKAFIEILNRRLSGLADASVGNYLSRINEKTDMVTRLINDFLDIARIRENKFALFYEEFSLDPFVRSVVSDIQLTTKTHRIRVVGQTRLQIRADKERLAQVLTNIIKNAIRYSPNSDSVTVTLGKDGRYAAIRVRDTGIGIAKEDLARIFDLFVKGRNVPKNQINGMGAGLYIAHMIMQQHGGKIEVQSSLGKGSVFRLLLPIDGMVTRKTKRQR